MFRKSKYASIWVIDVFLDPAKSPVEYYEFPPSHLKKSSLSFACGFSYCCSKIETSFYLDCLLPHLAYSGWPRSTNGNQNRAIFFFTANKNN